MKRGGADREDFEADSGEYRHLRHQQTHAAVGYGKASSGVVDDEIVDEAVDVGVGIAA